MRSATFVLLCLLMPACDRILPQREADMPPVDSVSAIYTRNGQTGEVTLDGRVVEFRARQDPTQLQRGGTLWARVGPYIYLFTPATREVFDTYEGVSAVRVVTTANGREVARATLARGELSDVLWRRSLNILGRALAEGTQKPRILEELVEWGEDHTEYRYDPAFVPE